MATPSTYLSALLLSLMILLTPCALHSFHSFKEMLAYADLYDEFIESDNKSLLNPIFARTYVQRIPSIIDRIKEECLGDTIRFGLVERSMLAASELVLARELMGYGYRHILELKHKPGDVLIVWGDLQGAFHSFVRGLTELKKQGIIDDTFTIIKPNHYLILNGNAVGLSVENLDMLLLICSLMKANPHQFIYIAGKHEDRDLWIDQGLLRQIAVLSQLSSVAFTTLFGYSHEDLMQMQYMLSRFFATLPLGLYINYKNLHQAPHNQCIRISNFGYETYELGTQYLGKVFAEQKSFDTLDNTLLSYRLSEKIKAEKSIMLSALITSVEGIIDYQKTNGLMKLTPVDGSTVYAIFSCPTTLHQLVNHFHNDAFAKITLPEELSTATITLFSRDLRTNKPFCASESYYLTSGLPYRDHSLALPKAPDNIFFGASVDLSKGASALGESIRQGATAAVETLHEKVSSVQPILRISFFDDASSARAMIANIRTIQTEYNCNIFCFPMIGEITQEYINTIIKDKIALLFPIIDISKSYTRTVSLRASCKRQVTALLDYALKNDTSANCCFFYQNDAVGLGALEIARDYFKNIGEANHLELSHLRNQTNFSTQIKEFKKHKINSIFFFTMSLAAREFIQQLGIEYLLETELYGISTLGNKVFRKFMTERGLPFTVCQVVPDPETSSIEIVQEYRERMHKLGLPLDTFSLEGYIGTLLLADAVNKIKGPITPQTVLDFFTQLHHYPFKGLTLTFMPESRDLNQPVWIDKGDHTWQKQ